MTMIMGNTPNVDIRRGVIERHRPAGQPDSIELVYTAGEEAGVVPGHPWGARVRRTSRAGCGG